MSKPRRRSLGALVVLGAVTLSSQTAGCRRGDCAQGCAQLVDNARREIEAQKLEPVVKKSLLEQADHSRPADVDACVAKCKAGDYDAACLEAARSVAGARECKR